jgi:TetR/AcrR family transcriptional regulator, transcriptional repressor for nem operon
VAQVSMRNAFVEAGRAEFHERGYTVTGIAAIAARAAAHKGSFYNHFASKEELAVEVLGLYAESQRLGMLEDTRLAPLDRIRTHFEFIAQTLKDTGPELGCMLANFSTEVSPDTPLIRAQITAFVPHWAELIAANLDEAARAAGVDDFDASSVAWMLIDGYEGAAVRARASASPAPIDNFLRRTLPLALSSV